MRRIWLIISGALVLTLFACTSIVSSTENTNTIHTDNVVINEIYYPKIYYENFYPHLLDNRISWFELYNPTDETVNMENWVVSFYSVDGLLYMPAVQIRPGEYIVVCANENRFIGDWAPLENLQIVELDWWGINWDSMFIRESVLGQVVDIVDDPTSGREGYSLPPIALGHSWARYAGGHDTDYFANDFYDESSPTPGMPNPKVREGGYLPVLTTGSVTPASGGIGTTFTYEVTYTDLDNDPPTYVRVYIDNIAHDMNMISGTYTGGTVYQYEWVTTSTDVGAHECYFEAGNDAYTARFFWGWFGVTASGGATTTTTTTTTTSSTTTTTVAPLPPVPGELVILCIGTVVIAIIVILGWFGLPPFRK